MYLKLPRAISPWRCGREGSESLYRSTSAILNRADPEQPLRGKYLLTTVYRIPQVLLHVKGDGCIDRQVCRSLGG